MSGWTAVLIFVMFVELGMLIVLSSIIAILYRQGRSVRYDLRTLRSRLEAVSGGTIDLETNDPAKGP